MMELPRAAQLGLSNQQTQRTPQRLLVTLCYRLARLLKIPPVLPVEIAIEFIRTLQRQIHF